MIQSMFIMTTTGYDTSLSPLLTISFPLTDCFVCVCDNDDMDE